MQPTGPDNKCRQAAACKQNSQTTFQASLLGLLQFAATWPKPLQLKHRTLCELFQLEPVPMPFAWEPYLSWASLGPWARLGFHGS